MLAHAPDEPSDPPTKAVVQIADDGSSTLYLGTQLVEHAAGVDASDVMQILVDYAATIETSVRVTTQMPDGTWTRHRLDPDGTLTTLPRNSQAWTTAARATGDASASRRRSRSTTTRFSGKVAPAWLIAIMIMLTAALMAIVVTT